MPTLLPEQNVKSVPAPRAADAAGGASSRQAISTVVGQTPGPTGIPAGQPGVPPRGGRVGRRWRCYKKPYHHGWLHSAAIQRGVEIVAHGGPMALTLRGLARDLGVTPAALIYYFQNRSGMRAAVANYAAEQLKPFSIARSGGIRAAEVLRTKAQGWVEFAANNANLYRLIFGEGWRGANPATMPRHEWVNSVDKISSQGQRSGHIQEGRPREHAWLMFAAVHGLACACADTEPPRREIQRILARFVGSLEGTPRRGRPPASQA